MRLILLVVGGTLLISVGLFFGLPYLTEEGKGKIEVNPLEHDAGTVSMAEGLVERTFEIKNNGEGDLKINSIWTSCMCTTARLKVGDKVSPEFGMHSGSIFWSQKIMPGEVAFLEVTFDPAFHGSQGVGQNIRVIYISSDDPQNKKVEVRLITNVVE